MEVNILNMVEFNRYLKKHFLTWKAFSYYFTHSHQMDETNSFFLFSSHSNAIISQIKGYRTITLEMVCFSFKTTTPLFNVSTFQKFWFAKSATLCPLFHNILTLLFSYFDMKIKMQKKNTHFPFHQKSTFEEITTTLFTTRFHNIHFFGFIFLHLLVQHSSLNLSLLLVFLNKPFLIRKTVLSEFVACILKNFHPVVFIWNDRTVPKHNRRCLSSNACSVRAKETIPLALYTLFSSKYSLTTIGNEKMVLKGFMEKDFFLHFSIPKSLRCFLLTNDFFFFLMGWPLTTSSILHGTSWTVSTSFSSTFPFHTLIY